MATTWVPARDGLDATRTRGFGLMLRMNIRGLTEDDVMAEIAPIDEVLMILRGYDRGVYTHQEVVTRLVRGRGLLPDCGTRRIPVRRLDRGDPRTGSLRLPKDRR